MSQKAVEKDEWDEPEIPLDDDLEKKGEAFSDEDVEPEDDEGQGEEPEEIVEGEPAKAPKATVPSSGLSLPDKKDSESDPPETRIDVDKAKRSLAIKLCGLSRVTHIGQGQKDNQPSLIVLVTDHKDDSFIPHKYLGYTVETKMLTGFIPVTATEHAERVDNKRKSAQFGS